MNTNTALSQEELFNLPLYGFFDYCRKNRISSFEMTRYIKRVTGDFDPELVECVRHDLDEYCKTIDMTKYFFEFFDDYKFVATNYGLLKLWEVSNDQDKREKYRLILNFIDGSEKFEKTYNLLIPIYTKNMRNLFFMGHMLDKKMNRDVETTDIIKEVPEGTGTNNLALTRDVTGHIFRILRNKGVINPGMSDIELSKYVSNMTGYSAKTLRKNNPPSEKSKAQAIELLEGIQRNLKRQ